MAVLQWLLLYDTVKRLLINNDRHIFRSPPPPSMHYIHTRIHTSLLKASWPCDSFPFTAPLLRTHVGKRTNRKPEPVCWRGQRVTQTLFFITLISGYEKHENNFNFSTKLWVSRQDGAVDHSCNNLQSRKFAILIKAYLHISWELQEVLSTW